MKSVMLVSSGLMLIAAVLVGWVQIKDKTHIINPVVILVIMTALIALSMIIKIIVL